MVAEYCHWGPFFLDEKLGMEEKFEVGRGPQLEKSFRK